MSSHSPEAVTPMFDALEPEALVAEARRRVRLERFENESFHEGLGRLTASLSREAGLSAFGRFIACGEILRNLEVGLQLTDWHTRNPEVGRQAIARPLVIVGMGRTGTTILHELLALDPANRVPLWWEVDMPFPPPERATFTTDPRIAEVEAQLAQIETRMPDLKRIHRMGATLPQECIRLTAVDFKSAGLSTAYGVPSYTEWLLCEADMTSAYRLHRRFLQLLQWRNPRERWVLKSPGHLWCLEALIRAYPDARLVQTHRDPLEALSSVASMATVVRRMASETVDPNAVAREWSRWMQLACDRSVDFRERSEARNVPIVDVHFDAFMADPVAQVRRIYARFDLELRSDVAQRMREYVERNPSDRDGRHAHRFEDTGLDLTAERAKVRRYQEYFDVASEPTSR